MTSFWIAAIGIVIAALVALGIGLVIAWKKSETFRDIVTATFDAVKGAIRAMVNVVQTIAEAFSAVIVWVKKNWPSS